MTDRLSDSLAFFLTSHIAEAVNCCGHLRWVVGVHNIKMTSETETNQLAAGRRHSVTVSAAAAARHHGVTCIMRWRGVVDYWVYDNRRQEASTSSFDTSVRASGNATCYYNIT